MSYKVPSPEWVVEFEKQINTSDAYANAAKTWEGDITLVIEGGPGIYLDLWHGKCRGVAALNDPAEKQSAFLLSATYENIKRIMTGKLDPMQAMLTRKLTVKGNMAVMMRSVPTVLDFVRCARDITTEIL